MILVVTGTGFGVQSLDTDQPATTILWQGTICKQEGKYIGWPTITKAVNGDLLAVFSGDRQYHVCPFGRVTMIRSRDQGQTWSRPEVIADIPIMDDRDSGILTTAEGTIIVSWFTSPFFALSSFAEKIKPYGIKNYDLWKPIIDQVDIETRKRWVGNWLIRSEDNGKSWSRYIRTHGNAPHGPIQLADGRLMMVGRDHYDGRMLGVTSYIEGEKQKIGIEVSYDDGRNWQVYSSIPISVDEKMTDFHEPHIVEDINGKLYVFIRYHGQGRCLRVSESCDGGKNWTVAGDSGISGYPPHLLRLKDGRIILSYGYRRGPYEQRAVVIDQAGKWNAEDFITLAVCHNHNLGYPASIQLEDGSIYTVYYQEETISKSSTEHIGGSTVLMATRWKLKD